MFYRFSKLKFFLGFTLGGGLLPATALAIPSAVGGFSASGIPTYVDSIPGGGCPIVSPIMASGTTDVMIDITGQTSGAGNFDVLQGSITITSPSPQTFTATISTGSLDDSGNFSISGSGGGLNLAEVEGVFDGSSLNVSTMQIQYAPSASNTCHANAASVTLNFSGGQIINPETAAGTDVKNSGNLRTETNNIVNPITDHVKRTMHGDAKNANLNESGFLIEGEGGLNAGGVQWGDVGVWLSYNFTATENDFFRTAFESDQHTFVGGIDYTPNDVIVVGLALAYENSDIETSFNSGELESDGITIAPYLGVLLSETWSLDASFGFSFIENDQFRLDPTTAARITSNPDTDRFFFSGNMNGITFVNNWILSGRVGYLFARSSTDAFTESNATSVAKRTTQLGQLRIGGDVAYSYGNWEPFVSAMYEYDVSFDQIVLTAGAQPDNDRDDILFGTGFRYFNDKGMSGMFEYRKRLFRNQFEEDSVSATFRYDF